MEQRTVSKTRRHSMIYSCSCMRPGFGLGFDGLGVPKVRVPLCGPYIYCGFEQFGVHVGTPVIEITISIKIAVTISVLGGYEWHLGVDENIWF